MYFCADSVIPEIAGQGIKNSLINSTYPVDVPFSSIYFNPNLEKVLMYSINNVEDTLALSVKKDWKKGYLTLNDNNESM